MEVKSQENLSINQEGLNSSNLKLVHGSQDKSKKSGKLGDKLQCIYCNKVLKTVDNPSKNKQAYQLHLMEEHYKKTLFKDIPENKNYFCPYENCSFKGTELKLRFIVHLGFRHREFSKRINRRMKELEEDAKSFDNLVECNNLTELKHLFQIDPRVIDISHPTPGDTWAEDCDTVSAESITKATGPSAKTSPNITPQLQVELSEDWLKELKAEPIKQEPGQTLEDNCLPLITLSSTPVISNLTDTVASVSAKPSEVISHIDDISENSKAVNIEPCLDQPAIEKARSNKSIVSENDNLEKKMEEKQKKEEMKKGQERLPDIIEPAKSIKMELEDKVEEKLENLLDSSKSLTETPTTPIKSIAESSEIVKGLSAVSENAEEATPAVSLPKLSPSSLCLSDHSNVSRESSNKQGSGKSSNKNYSGNSSNKNSSGNSSDKNVSGNSSNKKDCEDSSNITEIWSCKRCDKIFNGRQHAVRHVIETYNFMHIPTLIDERYKC